MESGAGWDVYSKMVLQQLQDLNNGMSELRNEIQEEDQMFLSQIEYANVFFLHFLL